MRYLYSQTEKDIKNFIDERDKDKWRTWDNPRKISFVKPDTEDRDHPEEEKIRLVLGRMYIQSVEMKIHARMCQEMVAFLTYCLGNDTWYTLWKLKVHRESNAKKRGQVMEDVKQRNQDSKSVPRCGEQWWRQEQEEELNLNWLQLTDGNKDMAIVGPDPLWLKLVREANEKK